MDGEGTREEHVVPQYRAGEGEAWFHFLHGNVPGHEIDFLYRPEVPQGALGRPHYSHLARLLRYIEPHARPSYAFTLGNLSRDDTQHEPGRGGVALVFGLRVHGATDHAGRPDPPFSHAIAAVDRALDAPAILRAAMAFHAQVLGGAASAEWYRAYVRAAPLAPPDLERLLADYVARFADLPRPEPSAMSLAWTTRGAAPPGRIVLVHPDDAPFEVLARAAARIGAVLYRSDVRWSAISNGREADLPNGTTVRFLPESAVGPGDAAPIQRPIDEIPEDEEAIARELFGAFPVAHSVAGARPWPDHASGGGAEGDEDDAAITVQRTPEKHDEPAPASPEAPPDAPLDTQEAAELAAPMVPIPVPLPLVEPPPLEASEPAPTLGRSRWKPVAAVTCILAGALAVVWGPFMTPPPEQAGPAAVTQQELPASAPPPVKEAVSPPPPSPAPSAPVRATQEKAKTLLSGARQHAAGKRCVVLNGRPCF